MARVDVPPPWDFSASTANTEQREKTKKPSEMLISTPFSTRTPGGKGIMGFSCYTRTNNEGADTFDHKEGRGPEADADELRKISLRKMRVMYNLKNVGGQRETCSRGSTASRRNLNNPPGKTRFQGGKPGELG